MTVETGSFYQMVDGLIKKASGILLPNLSEGHSFYQKFLDPTTDQKGNTALWVMQNSSRWLRVSATTIATADAIPPSTLVSPVVAPYTVLRLTVGSFTDPKKAAAFFKRIDYPGKVDLKVHGRQAIQPATEYLERLETALAAGTLTFPTQ